MWKKNHVWERLLLIILGVGLTYIGLLGFIWEFGLYYYSPKVLIAAALACKVVSFVIAGIGVVFMLASVLISNEDIERQEETDG